MTFFKVLVWWKVWNNKTVGLINLTSHQGLLILSRPVCHLYESNVPCVGACVSHFPSHCVYTHCQFPSVSVGEISEAYAKKARTVSRDRRSWKTKMHIHICTVQLFSLYPLHLICMHVWYICSSPMLKLSQARDHVDKC